MTEESQATAGTRSARLRRSLAALAQRLEPTVVGRLWSRLLELEFVDRSVALAAKAFVCFFPLLILVAAVTPPVVREQIFGILASRLGVAGEAYATVRQAFGGSAEEARATVDFVGVLITVAFGVSSTTALQRVYLRAWRRPPGGGIGNRGRGAVWVAGFIAFVLILSLVRTVIGGPTGTVVAWAVAPAAASGLWWWTARLMLRGEVRWRALLPTAVVTGVGTWLYSLAASWWMPVNVSNRFAEFGAFGIALAIVTWFTGLAFVIVVAAAIGPALAEGEDRFARWLRESRPTAVEAGAATALPGPARPMRLSAAFGRGAGLGGTERGPGTSERPRS